MHLVSLDRVHVEVEGRTLFTDVSFGLSTQDRAGVVGPNGSGKSTLLRVVAGRQPPTAGEVTLRTGIRIGWLEQDPDLGEVSAVDAVLRDTPTAREHEAAAILDRLGIETGVDLDLVVDASLGLSRATGLTLSSKALLAARSRRQRAPGT